jgi:hypothetical protein
MAGAKIITVVGVTGLQGSAVANTFLGVAEFNVRGLTRSVDSPAAQKLASAGVALVQADLDDKESLIKAFQGSHAIYANTDFWGLTKYPNLSDLLATKYKGKALPDACMEHEIQQATNIIDAAAKVLADGSPLEVFVLSTLSHASKWSNGELKHVRHFDAKAMVKDDLEERHPQLAKISRYLQVGFYMQNVLDPLMLPRKGEDGVYEFYWANMTESTVFTSTSPGQDTGVFVKALISAPAGTVLLGESDPLSVDEFMETWSAVTGHFARLHVITTEQLEALVDPMMPGFGKEFAENFQYYRDFTYTGRDPDVLRPADLGIDQSRLATFKDFLKEQDWSRLLQS